MLFRNKDDKIFGVTPSWRVQSNCFCQLPNRCKSQTSDWCHSLHRQQTFPQTAGRGCGQPLVEARRGWSIELKKEAGTTRCLSWVGRRNRQLSLALIKFVAYNDHFIIVVRFLDIRFPGDDILENLQQPQTILHLHLWIVPSWWEPIVVLATGICLRHRGDCCLLGRKTAHQGSHTLLGPNLLMWNRARIISLDLWNFQICID